MAPTDKRRCSSLALLQEWSIPAVTSQTGHLMYVNRVGDSRASPEDAFSSQQRIGSSERCVQIRSELPLVESTDKVKQHEDYEETK